MTWFPNGAKTRKTGVLGHKRCVNDRHFRAKARAWFRSREARLVLGSALILAIGCSTAQRAAESVPLEDRLRAEVVALHTLCIELPDNAAPDLRQLCAMFTDPTGEGPISGDGGPAPIIEERKPGPGEGQGVRKAE